MAKTFEQFRKQVLGKRYDMDGEYGFQCWDGYAYYMKWLGYKYSNCTKSKYVKDIWEQRKTNGMLKYCNEVTVMQPGDIAVFREVKDWTPYSHVAMFVKDLGNGYGLFLGQNQGGVNGAFNEETFPYSATYDTAFRPKCFAKKSSKPTTPKCDDILTVGSVVTSKAMKVAIPKGATTAVKKINGDECIYVPELGGYFPTRFLSEADASDGKKDNYFANTKTKVYVDQCSVQKVDVKNNRVMIHNIWVNAKPLIEVKEGK